MGSLCVLCGLCILVLKQSREPEVPPAQQAATASPEAIRGPEETPPQNPNPPPEVDPQGDASELPAIPDPGGSISGRVLDGAGKPIPGALVQVGVSADTIDKSDEPLTRVLSSKAVVDAEGQYRISGLPPRKDYVLRASHSDFAPTSLEEVAVGEMEAVEGQDLILLPGGTIAGRVLDEAGNGIAGARLWVRLDSSPEEGYVSPLETVHRDPVRDPDAKTDAGGSYRLPHLPAEVHALRVRDEAARLLPGSEGGIEVTEGEVTEVPDIVLTVGESFAGRVVDPDGKPIAGAEVRVSIAADGLSSDDGTFEVTGLPPGKVHVNVVRKGYRHVIDAVVAPAQDVVFTMIPTSAIIGQVRAKGQEVFPELRIMVICRTSEAIESFNAQTVDRSGRFEVEGKAGVYVLTALVPGFAPTSSTEIPLAAHERKEGVVIVLDRGASIRGKILAKRTRDPIQGAWFSVSRSAPTGADRWAPVSGGSNVRSGPDGSFVLDGVLEGLVDLEATHSDYTMTELKGIEIRKSQPAEVTIELGEGGRIRGTARQGARPVSGARISAMRLGEHLSLEALSDSEGRFEVKALEEGEYVLRLMMASPSGGHVTKHAELVVVKDGETTEVDLVEPALVKLSGRVTLSGAPVAGGTIEAERSESGSSGEAKIDASGAYSLDLEGSGTYVLSVQRPIAEGGTCRVEIPVPAGAAELRRDIDLPAGEISGLVLNRASGEAIAEAQVWAYPGGTPVRTILSLHEVVRSAAQTDEAGRFVLSGLAPGTHSLRAFAAGHLEGSVDGLRVESRGGPDDVRILLEAGTRFEATVVDGEGLPVEDARVNLLTPEGDPVLLDPAASSDKGLVALLAPRDGSYKLRLLHDEYAPLTVPIRIGEGEAPVKLALRKGGKLRVRVSGLKGKPVAGAAVQVLTSEDGVRGEDLALYLPEIGMPSVTQIDGHVVLQQAPPGVYLVSARKGGAISREETVVVMAGKTVEVSLVIGE